MRSCLLNDSLTDNGKLFKFGYDSDGNYGYYKDGADTVTPFSSWGYDMESNLSLSNNVAKTINLDYKPHLVITLLNNSSPCIYYLDDNNVQQTFMNSTDAEFAINDTGFTCKTS